MKNSPKMSLVWKTRSHAIQAQAGADTVYMCESFFCGEQLVFANKSVIAGISRGAPPPISVWRFSSPAS